MKRCKITVLKRIYNRELISEYCSLDLPENCTGCPRFKVGDEFIVDSHNDVPQGFCSWAWADIQKDVLTIMFDGNVPWIKQKGTTITCCTDGLMPVIFRIEGIVD
ncbi:MAG: TIGR04076 family protein [Prolixibacteraceae bacterium]|jgi:uncharacterized repeat protein (TIGR04076 family)|nr:TIGR04076 family protein [Prolixibacteraceae bacterium]